MKFSRAKTISASILMSLLTIGSSSAQDKKIQFGLKTGINASQFTYPIFGEKGDLLGLHFGVYMRAPLSRVLFLRPEISYSRQGQNDEVRSSPGTATYTTTLNYINVPVLLEVGRKVTFQFGPQLGLALSAHAKGADDTFYMDADLTGQCKLAELSIVGGVAFYPLKHVNFGMRYQYGVTKAMFAGNNPGLKNRVFHVFVAYSF